MQKKAEQTRARHSVRIDTHKLTELRRLLKVGTEEEASRIAIAESLRNHCAGRSLNRFLDTLAQEQAPLQS